MFKTKLQEYCQSKSWLLPGYGVTREGADHLPRFKAVVQVNGFSFTSPDFCNTSKEAQNLAAKLAFEHFTGRSNMGTSMTSASDSSSARLPETQQISPTASCDRANPVTKDTDMFKDGTHMYKHQLQIYAQRRNLELPVYSVEREGPCHASCFKCKVTLEDKTYESEQYFPTVKEAESASAKVALASIFPRGFEEDDPSIYKNLLQQFLQKEKEMSCLPTYTTTLEGPPHMPVFVSMVEIQRETFRGQEANTKKQAEMNAAKVAYIALRERRCKKDDSLNALGAHLKNALQFSSANIPEGGSDAQPMFDKQVECNQDFTDKGTKATPNTFTGIPGGIQELKATQSAKEPSSWSTNPSSSIRSKPVNGLDKEKEKKKIMVLPRSSTRSYPDAHVKHSDEKWIAFTTRSC